MHSHLIVRLLKSKMCCKKYIFSYLPGCILLIGLNPPVAQAEDALSGREVMERQRERHVAPREVATYSMELLEGGATVGERRLTQMSQRGDDGRLAVVTRFDFPRAIDGVALLSLEQAEGEEDQQWLHLPATGRTRRIVGAAKRSSFMGTDLTYEDLMAENLAAHRYELTGKTMLDGAPCYTIVATPAAEDRTRLSAYGKRILLVDQGTFIIRETRYFNRGGTLVKRSTAEDFQDYGQGRLRAGRLTVSDLERGTATLLILGEVDFSRELPEAAFSPRLFGNLRL